MSDRSTTLSRQADVQRGLCCSLVTVADAIGAHSVDPLRIVHALGGSEASVLYVTFGFPEMILQCYFWSGCLHGQVV